MGSTARTGGDWVRNSTEQQEPATACLGQHMISFNYGGYEGNTSGGDWVRNSTEQQQQEPATACLEQHMTFFNYGGYEGNTSVSVSFVAVG